ncbi:MAG: flavin reductase family protein [Paracoccaceae bacterium]
MTEASFAPDADNARAYREALGQFSTGVAVITTTGPLGPMGFTANSFASVSLDPPLVLWSPARASARFAVFAAAHHYAIHILAADQLALCGRFIRGGAGFDGLAMQYNSEAVPVLPGTLARFDCEQHATHDGGDHLIIVGRVIRCVLTQGAPLVFSRGAYGSFAPLG